MQYDAKTPEEYLKLLEDDWRKEKLLVIRKMILEYAPELEETIRYKMLNYGSVEKDDYIFALNAQKHYVSLYVGSIEKIDPSRELLSDFNLGKGCIRVKKVNNLETSNLKEFINRTIELWRQDKDIYC